jgi:predicted  nucleic acid-binding Zn-ribbon protein
MSSTNVQLVITAQDNASAVLRRVSAEMKSASSSLPSFSRAFSTELGLIKTAAHYAALGIASVGAAVTAWGVASVKSASNYEQSRIAFDTMLGSADKAKKLLQEITKFAKETPFELPEVVEGSKKLLAYNISAEQIIPTFKMLGEIASGVGKDKLPQLVLAFGQVKAATRLTGMELRQFTETGVPMLSILTQLGKEGKLTSQSQQSVGRSTAGSSAKIKELNTQLSIAQQRLKEVKKNTDAKKSSVMSATASVEKYKNKLAAASAVTTGLGKSSEITEAKIVDMVSEGLIKYADVELALKSLTTEGGRFNNLMIRQSTTLGGVFSNLKDSIGILSREIIGMNEQGDVREGSLFDRLRIAASSFYGLLESKKDAIAQFFSEKVDGAVKSVREWYERVGGANGITEALKSFWEKLTKDVLPALRDFVSIMLSSVKWIKDNWDWLWKVIVAFEGLKAILFVGGVIKAMTEFGGAIKGVTALIAGKVGLSAALAALPMAVVITVALAGFALIMAQIKGINDAIGSIEKSRSDLDKTMSSLSGKLKSAEGEDKEKIKNQIKQVENAYKEIAKGQTSIADSLSFTGLVKGIFGKALGGSVAQGTPYVVGEYRPEVFVPSQSGNIRQVSDMQKEVTINFNNVSVRNDQDINEIAYRVKRILNRESEMYQLGVV